LSRKLRKYIIFKISFNIICNFKVQAPVAFHFKEVLHLRAQGNFKLAYPKDAATTSELQLRHQKLGDTISSKIVSSNKSRMRN
jgi:hypothetical protein